MSKVLVDRELLELLRNFTFLHDDGCAGALRGNIDKALAARPAEAEGVVIAAKCVNRKCLRHNAMLSDYGLTLPHGEALVRQSDHRAALSAVTADRDRLHSTVEDLELALQDAEERAESAGRNASAFEDHMGDLQVENGKLRDARDQLRAEVDALRAFVMDCTETAGGMVNGNKLSHRAKEVIAAMAAKEE